MTCGRVLRKDKKKEGGALQFEIMVYSGNGGSSLHRSFFEERGSHPSLKSYRMIYRYGTWLIKITLYQGYVRYTTLIILWFHATISKQGVTLFPKWRKLNQVIFSRVIISELKGTLSPLSIHGHTNHTWALNLYYIGRAKTHGHSIHTSPICTICGIERFFPNNNNNNCHSSMTCKKDAYITLTRHT